MQEIVRSRGLFSLFIPSLTLQSINTTITSHSIYPIHQPLPYDSAFSLVFFPSFEMLPGKAKVDISVSCIFVFAYLVRDVRPLELGLTDTVQYLSTPSLLPEPTRPVRRL